MEIDTDKLLKSIREHQSEIEQDVATLAEADPIVNEILGILREQHTRLAAVLTEHRLQDDPT